MITPINMGQKKQKTNPLEYVSKGLDMANSVASIGSKVSDMKFGGGNKVAASNQGTAKIPNSDHFSIMGYAKSRIKAR